MADQYCSNCTNWTVVTMDDPRADTLDYAEIVLLTCMVITGGPLNLLCFYRAFSTYCRTDANSSRRDGWRRTSDRRASPSISRSAALRLHLTTANLFIICIYGVSQIAWLFTYSWRGGDFLCRLVKFFHTFCFYSTSNIIVMIAIDRLYVTTYVDRPPQSPTRLNGRWFNFIVRWLPWILAFICSVPQLFVWNVIAPYPDKPDWFQCVTSWLAWKVDNLDGLANNDQLGVVASQETIYSISHLVLVFWCPAFIVVCSYAVIIARFRKKITKTRMETRRLQRSANMEQFRVRVSKMHRRPYRSHSTALASDSADTTNSDSASAGLLTDVPIIITAPQMFLSSHRPVSANVAIQTLSKVKRRTVRAGACIAFAYVACWTPYNALELWRFFDPTLDNRYLELLSNLIVLNAVLNPLIYDIRLSLR